MRHEYYYYDRQALLAAPKLPLEVLEDNAAVFQAIAREMVEEIVYNLCDNGIRYNVPGGKVLVTVEPEGERVCLVVEDTGIGIPKEYQERVFERFYRVDKSRSKATGGTGLGLAIVKHMAAQHHAELLLQSEPGRGTRITILFERAEISDGDSGKETSGSGKDTEVENSE